MILVQPQSRIYDEYLGFINENSFGFEVIDFMYPAVLDHKKSHPALLERYKNVPVNALHGPFIDINYSGGDRRVFRVSKNRLVQCAALAQSMNVQKIVIHSCFFPILQRDDVLYKLWSEESAQLLNAIAEKYNIFFCIENVLDKDPDIILQMVKAADPRFVGVCLDIGHAFLSPTDPVVWLRSLAPYIRHIHLSDNHGYYDDHIALGDGDIDWQTVLSVIQEENISGDFTIEVKTLDYVKKSTELLRHYNFI